MNRSILALAVVAASFTVGCRGTPGPEAPAPGAAPPAGGASAGTGAGAAPAAAAPTRVTLTDDAARQAGIATEEAHARPFAVTLPLIARLSPVAETPEELEARLAYQVAESRSRRAAQELERVRKLVADNVVATKVLQAAEADAAESRLEQLRAETALRNLGLEAAHSPAYPHADLWALADLYGPQVSQVKPGAPAYISVESFPGETFPARVVALARSLKPQTRTLTVRIAIQDPQHRLRPQDTATAEVQVSERTALSVPVSALLYEGTDRILFVRRGEGYEKVPVQVGAQQAGRAEILQGLAEGDAVVTRGGQSLFGEIYKVLVPATEED